jgi:hypothetical protein
MMNESKFLAIYRRLQDSGLTTKEFCSNEGIPESTYYYWNKKTKHKRGNQSFIPLVVNSGQPVGSQGYVGTAPVPESGNAGDSFLLELEYRNGTKLRIQQGMDLVHLRTLVCLLD